MNNENILIDLIGQINEEYVHKHFTYIPKQSRKNLTLSFAACFFAVMLTAYAIWVIAKPQPQVLPAPDTTDSSSETPEIIYNYNYYETEVSLKEPSDGKVLIQGMLYDYMNGPDTSNQKYAVSIKFHSYYYKELQQQEYNKIIEEYERLIDQIDKSNSSEYYNELYKLTQERDMKIRELRIDSKKYISDTLGSQGFTVYEKSVTYTDGSTENFNVIYATKDEILNITVPENISLTLTLAPSYIESTSPIDRYFEIE